MVAMIWSHSKASFRLIGRNGFPLVECLSHSLKLTRVRNVNRVFMHLLKLCNPCHLRRAEDLVAPFQPRSLGPDDLPFPNLDIRRSHFPPRLLLRPPAHQEFPPHHQVRSFFDPAPDDRLGLSAFPY